MSLTFLPIAPLSSDDAVSSPQGPRQKGHQQYAQQLTRVSDPQKGDWTSWVVPGQAAALPGTELPKVGKGCQLQKVTKLPMKPLL